MKSVLFLCTGNSCRSILAEAYLTHAGKHAGKGAWRGYSAGSTPTGTVHPMALETLAAHGIEAADAASKSWDAFSGGQAQQMDFVITVCNNAAGEACPVWPGLPVTDHWPFPDPAKFVGDEDAMRAHFNEAFAMIKARIGAFLDGQSV